MVIANTQNSFLVIVSSAFLYNNNASCFEIHTTIQKFGFYSESSGLHCYRKCIFQINTVLLNFLFIKEPCITVSSKL